MVVLPSGPVPGEARAEPDQRRASDPARRLLQPLRPAQSVHHDGGEQHSGDVGAGEGDVDDDAQHQHLQPDGPGARGVDELRQEGDEEQGDLGVEQLHDDALHERAPDALVRHDRHGAQPATADHAETEPGEVERAGQLHGEEELGNVEEQGGKPEGRGRDMGIAAEMDAERGEEPAPPPARHGLRRRVEQRRPRKGREYGRREGEGQEDVPGGHQADLSSEPAIRPTFSTNWPSGRPFQ
jgi:hypothetical protein